MLFRFSSWLFIIIVFNRFKVIRLEEFHNDKVTINRDEYFLPSIQIVVLIHPFNKAQYLPYLLGSIESQNYPKNRIRIKLITERIFYEYDNDESPMFYKEPEDIDLLLDERIRLNEKTIRILKRWTNENEDYYNNIELSILNTKLPIDTIDSKTYWNKDHYTRLIDYKNQELYQSFFIWADWLIFLDADVVLTNSMMFYNLTSSDKVIISPMLKSFNTYSNFWAGMDDTGYYVRSDDYLPILERKKRGRFSVPMVHSCVLINLRKKASKLLTFDPIELEQLLNIRQDMMINKIPYDDIIAFAKSASLNEIELYIDNIEKWGWIPSPIVEDKFSIEQSQQELIDLELESLVEGPPLPISLSLEQYVIRDTNFDTLGVDQIFIVNLARRPERRKRMEQCLNLLGIKAKFKLATDGKELNEEFLRKHGIRTLDGYVDPYHKRPITFGEIGCFLSHYRIWQESYRNNYSKIIVLEDDVRFDLNFRAQWAKILENFELISNDYDFLYLGRKLNDGEYDKEEIVNELFVRPRYSYWTIGYLLTRNGIEKLLNSNPTNRMIPVDEYLPIMYGSHINETLINIFKINDGNKLRALSLRHLIVSPTHYVGDALYISDTEQSDKVNDMDIVEKYDNFNDENLLTENLKFNNDNNNDQKQWKIQPPPSTLSNNEKIQHFDL